MGTFCMLGHFTMFHDGRRFLGDVLYVGTFYNVSWRETFFRGRFVCWDISSQGGIMWRGFVMECFLYKSVNHIPKYCTS